jgi:hypothetical protein
MKTVLFFLFVLLMVGCDDAGPESSAPIPPYDSTIVDSSTVDSVP